MRILLLAFFCFLLIPVDSVAQDIILKLNPAEKSSQEKNYTFDEVIDLRVSKTVGEIYDSGRKKHKATFGAKLPEETLELFTSKITPSQQLLHRISIKIYNLDLKEIYQADRNAYKGDLQLGLGFFINGKNEPVHLVDFNGKIQYNRPASQMHHVEASIQRLFENSREYFDAWISTQYQSNRALVKKVRLNIIDPIRPSSKDTVFYDPDRPLSWSDFTETPNPRSSFNATIFSSLSIEGNATIEEGEIVQTLEIKVYMLPNQSWVKNANDYASNHEQRHFDLTRIAADRMIARLKNTELEPELFEAKLNTIYMDSYREMNRLQELYDGQTRHGLNKEMQARWNLIITQALGGNWEKLDALLSGEE
ncbi:hypothetical protein J2X69_003000 [Algoriphagus sp. 4150]|uniref:hypothetical protein n=1 Tax=Algoriphagus sp. 4150 TaxID=2817756 RepID=UPI0028678427|nr:hypothetical protein [Algoriphagus sp. 4150]MDR7130643.1 hypothetical protein [Algoriphagus sp. 4150]